VRLMGLVPRPMSDYATLPSGLKIMWMDRQPVGTQCYVITRDAAEQLLEHTYRIIHAIDTTIDRHWEHKLRLLITSPAMVSEVPMQSTVAASGGAPTLFTRLREKLYRRLDKLAAARYNAANRPKSAIAL
jgi:glycosyl transferase family 25